MNRAQFLDFESASARRVFSTPFELRAASDDGNTLTFEGYASVTEREYPVFGGTFPGWMETIANGAFKRTLKNNADVAFLINHDGLTLARTKSGTLELNEDKTGLRVLATLDARQGPVNDLRIASERGDIDEMSFAFRVEADEWFDDDGNESNSWEGTQRRITEVNLNKGDVSAVNYGANDATSGGFRELELALAELRSGRLSDDTRSKIRELAAALDGKRENTITVKIEADTSVVMAELAAVEQTSERFMRALEREVVRREAARQR